MILRTYIYDGGNVAKIKNKKMKPLDKTIKIYDNWMSEKDCKMFIEIYKNLQKAGYTSKKTTMKETKRV